MYIAIELHVLENLYSYIVNCVDSAILRRDWFIYVKLCKISFYVIIFILRE